ncbi:MAG: SRPBCC family protein [Nitriliruptorales bacterium]|nr:SRPBCC family protein [Nitriliruptorales bacterium]
MRIEQHIDIDRPAPEVFEVIRNPNNDPRWCPTVHHSTQVKGDGPTVGAVYEQVHKPGPAKPTELTVELLEIEAPHHLRLRSVDDLAWFDVHYHLEELPGERTRLTQVDETHFQGFAKLLQPIMWLAINSGIKKQFRELKQLLETGDVPKPAH